MNAELIDRLREDIVTHGEVHAVVEEPDAGEHFGDGQEEVELRLGTTEFDSEAGLVTIEGADTIHRLRLDSIVRWYLPVEVAH